VNKTNTKNTRWDELNNSINILESNIAIRHNETHQRILEMTTNMEMHERKFRNLQEITNNNGNNINIVQKELVFTNEKISTSKNDLLNSLNDQ